MNDIEVIINLVKIGWSKIMRLSLWIKFCLVFIGSIFLTGDLLSQNDPQSDSLNLKQNLYAIDIDGNDDLDALTDGLLILRGMFGLTGEALTSGANSEI